jgi:UDPglucose 6-dehydrogenase
MTMERVAIIGTGRVGLCLALSLERCGHDVLGVDANAERVDSIRNRTLRSPEPGVEEALRAAQRLRVESRLDGTVEFSPTEIFIAVDTPTSVDGGYDAAGVDRVIGDLCALGRPARRTELVLVSTVMPGYCDSKASEAAAFGYSLSYSPEFVAQGSILRDQQYPAQMLIGEADEEAGERIAGVYRRMCRNQPPIRRMSRLSAEIAKLATNGFLTMKIAFANAVGDLALTVGADAESVLAAIAADPRVGTALMNYGFGYGGPCLPRDNRALNYFARRHGSELLQAIATDAMNLRHQDFQVEEYLRSHPEEQSVHFHSVSYKPGTEILDESQPLAVAIRLARAGRRVVIHERAAVVAELRARFPGLFEYGDRAPSAEDVLETVSDVQHRHGAGRQRV